VDGREGAAQRPSPSPARSAHLKPGRPPTLLAPLAPPLAGTAAAAGPARDSRPHRARLRPEALLWRPVVHPGRARRGAGGVRGGRRRWAARSALTARSRWRGNIECSGLSMRESLADLPRAAGRPVDNLSVRRM
jgi:hypothetical protein